MDLLHRLAAFLDTPSIPWKRLILTFAIGEFALESYLSWRQYRVLCRTIPPPQLKREIDQKTYDKSQAYGRAKAKFGFVSGVFSQIKNYFVITRNVYPWLWRVTGTWLLQAWWPKALQGEITHSLVFAFTYGFAETLLGLPFSYYHTFVLEEKFGFNKQTLGLWVTDLLKSQALSLGFGIPLGSAFLWIIQKTGDRFFFYLWAFTLAVQLAAITIYPILIVPLFNKLTPLEAGPLKDRVEALAQRLKFPLAELQVIDGSKRSAHSNAYFTGLPWKKKIVIYDTLIEKSEVEEVEAVLAHELGHWKKGHTTKLLGISSFHLLYVFVLFSVFINNKSLYEAFGFYKEKPIIIGFILFNEVLSPTDSIVKLLMNILTRSMEFEADAFSHSLGYSESLARALIKLQIQNLSSMDADYLYSSYHYSHPILTERLKAVGWKGDTTVGTGVANGGVKAKDEL
ncbi:peptidase family M48-domain-containing protein [Neohortaea acidophila]|uniref:CAAX prenyl protease n=1 Tax=Neohortaea acidophila TaxID=245834 RepID=A0A6A6PL23_9PEZI|nr:peptidase family M48-domain-containing protein [Neohortaea acidophila]KAF2480625.1 peptidase family M48-domain-containing protein [Neohortaea acidophila]